MDSRDPLVAASPGLGLEASGVYEVLDGLEVTEIHVLLPSSSVIKDVWSSLSSGFLLV